MKLILEKNNDTYYAYFETEKHFKRVDKQRKARVMYPRQVLSEECDLSISLAEGEYMVFEVKDNHK